MTKFDVHRADAYRILEKHFKRIKSYFTYIKLSKSVPIELLYAPTHFNPERTHKQHTPTCYHKHKVGNIINVSTKKKRTPSVILWRSRTCRKKQVSLQFHLLLNLKISVEPLHKNRNIVQCARCENYNQTKSYCNRLYTCVKCRGQHKTVSCMKTRDIPAACVLCKGLHSANYKGCTVYHKLQAKLSQQSQQITKEDLSFKLENQNSRHFQPNINQMLRNTTYANEVAISHSQHMT